LQHCTQFGRLAAEEIGSLRAVIGRIDRALDDGRAESRRGQVRALLDQRSRMSAHLEQWYAQFGLTSASRVEVGAKLTGGLNAEIARRRAEHT
jgi:hypothetical protein